MIHQDSSNARPSIGRVDMFSNMLKRNDKQLILKQPSSPLLHNKNPKNKPPIPLYPQSNMPSGNNIGSRKIDFTCDQVLQDTSTEPDHSNLLCEETLDPEIEDTPKVVPSSPLHPSVMMMNKRTSTEASSKSPMNNATSRGASPEKRLRNIMERTRKMVLVLKRTCDEKQRELEQKQRRIDKLQKYEKENKLLKNELMRLKSKYGE